MAHVLIVDDEKSIRVTLSRFLLSEGYDVEVAEDAESAFECFTTREFDVVVSDVVLPRVTGIELMHRIKERSPGVQVVVMTGEPTVDTAAEAVRAGAFDYLAKPINRAAIVKAVASAARVKMLADEKERLSIENRQYQTRLEELVQERTTALRETEEQLRHSQKMEAIGLLAGGIAHDFNNLLMVIGCGCEFAKQSLEDDSSAHEDLDQVLSAVDRAALLTRQLLAFSRRQVLCPEIVDLNKRLHDLIDMLDLLIGGGIEVKFVQGDGLGLVRVDPTQLEQVVVNLVVNARDAMAGDGLLTIATANVTLGEGHKQPPGDYVRLSITDTGSGIPPEILERIFDPFFTTKPEGKGTGLGLSTVYGIIEQHGGFVDVETAPGAGTTFRVYLPEAEGEEKPWATVDAECPCDGETILLVEDEEAVRHMESRVLASLGYQVLEASSAAEALDVLIGGTFKIDVVLTDVCMPKISGKQLADDVSLRWPGTKVILTSGYVGDTLDRRGVDELAYPFVHKPFNRRQVSAAIRGVLDGAPVEA